MRIACKTFISLLVGALAAVPSLTFAGDACSIPTATTMHICMEYYVSGDTGSDGESLCGQCKTWKDTPQMNSTYTYDQPVMRGEWWAACGKNPVTQKHEFITRSLTDPDLDVKIEATLVRDLKGSPVAANPVKLRGILKKDNSVASSDTALTAKIGSVKGQLQTFLNSNFLFTWGDTPSEFQSHGVPNDGSLTNPLCPQAGGTIDEVEVPDINKYSVEFTREDCVDASGDGKPNYKTDCDIPEGDYQVTMSVKGLKGRVKPPGMPVVPRDGSGNPYSSAAADGTGGWLWALNDAINVDGSGAAIGTVPFGDCGATCPDPHTGTLAPFNAGERIVLKNVTPELFMVGPLKLETSRKDDPASITYSTFEQSLNGTGHYRVYAGYDEADLLVDPYNVVYTDGKGWWMPDWQKTTYGSYLLYNDAANIYEDHTNPVPPASPQHLWTTEPIQLGKGLLPYWDNDGAYNLARITALEVVRETATNAIPQNLTTASGNFDPIIDRLKKGYTPYNIYNGMAVNHCALLKAGAKMLQDGTAGLNVTRNLFYIGGCPTSTTAGSTALYETNAVKWFAGGNDTGGVPGDLDNSTLLLKTLQNPDIAGSPGLTTQCFKDVKGSVDNLFVLTSANCSAMADNVSQLNVVGSGCEKACKLQSGDDSISDCAARFLYCLTGSSREIRKK